ncbi:MAG: nitrite reductase large subunit NirB [Bacteroidota bacterium]
MRKKIVIIGNGMVSYKFCEKFITHTLSDKYHLTILGEEINSAYDRVHLSSFFSSESAEELSLAPKEWYLKNGIQLELGALVVHINRQNKEITTYNGSKYTYDYLVIATGSTPFVPKIEGIDKSGVFVYRTIEDLEAILSYGKKVAQGSNKRAAVLGGGLLGLEAAKAVKDMGLDPCVVEFAPRLMPRQLDDAGADLLKSMIEEFGVEVHTSKNTTAILGDSAISGMAFADGQEIDVNMLVISAGIRPRDELARQCALEVGPRGGIVVDATMQTSDPDIYAIGEVAYYQGSTYGLVAPGYEMAEVALNQILGSGLQMQESIDMSTQLKLIGIDVGSFGDALGDSSCRSIVYEDKLGKVYKRINVSEDGKHLLGGILVGDTQDYNMLLQIAKNKMALPPQPEDLILGSRDGQSSNSHSVLDLPDSAIICSCENISKGALVDAVENQGCESVKKLSQFNKACTGCGGCKPMVKDLLNASLAKMGKTVKSVICEHFPYARHELYDLIKIKGITSYNQALDELGHGDGCETCKPALASVFAGVYNETAVVQNTIQDTNDRFLANIQRNGSYSVVPRIPGGEITPEKLIVIGQVAHKYNLYTKITGAQRIDLFGAQLNDLPFIWKELIDAGFESGHAYGKALRTVKSCVGSTWCRFGMDESVSFAIELENRYRGIRSPHKLKGGVSGCIRECAEARCKDFGLIATEKGWNVYVCGNGGANPKHATLLVENISKEYAIKYIDRFLMFYIKTAPPLTRTAPWLDKLEGGIDYLRDVVIEDSLGIAAELEQEMQSLVNTYECEWKQVVDSPELRKRFKHFANSDEKDDNIKFVPLRDQKMPAPWA